MTIWQDSKVSCSATVLCKMLHQGRYVEMDSQIFSCRAAEDKRFNLHRRVRNLLRLGGSDLWQAAVRMHRRTCCTWCSGIGGWFWWVRGSGEDSVICVHCGISSVEWTGPALLSPAQPSLAKPNLVPPSPVWCRLAQPGYALPTRCRPAQHHTGQPSVNIPTSSWWKES